MDNNFRVSVTAAIDKFNTDLYYKKKRQIEKEKILASVVIPKIDSSRVRMSLDDLRKRIEEVKKSGGSTVGKTLVDPKDISKIKQTTLEYRTRNGVIRETWELGKKKDGTDRAELDLKNRVLLSEKYLLQSEKERLKISVEEVNLEKQQVGLNQKLEAIENRRTIAEEKSEERLKKQTQTLIDRSRLKQAGFTSKIESGKYTPESMAPAQKLYSQLESTTAAAGLIKPENLDKYNAAIKRLHTEIGIAEKGFVRVKKESQSFGDSLKSKVSNLLQYASASAILFGALQQLQQGVQYIKELNKAMTDIQIVSGATSQEVDSMVVGFNELAKEVGATTLEVAEGSLQWYRQGKSAADTALLLRNSMMMSKLAGIESAEATDYMTSIMNGFNLTAEETTEVLDKLTALDNASATSTAITFGGTHSNMGIIQLWYN